MLTLEIQVFDAVVDECNKQRIYVHLDNHIANSSWCCTFDDGNAWWGDTYFSTANWTRGLSYMADHVRTFLRPMSAPVTVSYGTNID